MDKPTPNATTRPSTLASPSPGTSTGTNAGTARTIPAASAKPSDPPTTLNTTLSVSSCLTSRPCPAPSALRTASSRRRAFPRASSRPATFAHASSNTRPVAAVNIRSTGRNGAPSASCNGVTRDCHTAFSGLGLWSRARSRIARTSASACSGDTPCRRRPSPVKPLMWTAPPASGVSSGATTNGTHSSVLSNSKPSRRTPATTCGSPSTATNSPATSGSDANTFVHTPWLNSTVRCAPSTASEGAKSRPSCGSAPSSGKNDGDTRLRASWSARSGRRRETHWARAPQADRTTGPRPTAVAEWNSTDAEPLPETRPKLVRRSRSGRVPDTATAGRGDHGRD